MYREAYRMIAVRALRDGRLDEANHHLHLAMLFEPQTKPRRIGAGAADLGRLRTELAHRQVLQALSTGDHYQATQALAALGALDPALHRLLWKRLFWASYGGLIGLGALAAVLLLFACLATLHQRVLVSRLMHVDEAEVGPSLRHPYR